MLRGMGAIHKNTSRDGSPPAPQIRGFFAIGVDNISKAQNVGNLLRTSYSFGASYFFTIAASYSKRELRQSDTSAASGSLPMYEFKNADQMLIPRGATVVGVELTDDAIDLPSFQHPKQAVYILGPEGGNLSPDIVKRCDFIIKIPMRFCVNVGVAGAIVMYDRLVCLGRHAPRPVRTGGPLAADHSIKPTVPLFDEAEKYLG